MLNHRYVHDRCLIIVMFLIMLNTGNCNVHDHA
jgi:hypothetical protein